MNVSLTPELAEFVEGELARGDYGTASEVVRAALRMLARDRQVHEEKLAALRREVQVGIDQVDRGEFAEVTIGEIGAAVRAGHARRRRA